MTWFYILLAILLFIALILIIPIGVRADFEKELKVTLKIGFVPVTLYPPKPKKPKKKKEKEPKKKEKPKEEKPKEKKPSIIKEKGIMWLVDTIKQAAALALGALKDFFRHLKIKQLNVSIIYHGEDASDTAVKYGYFCLSVYPAVSILAGIAKCRSYGVDIAPDFDDTHTSRYAVDIHVSTRVFWLLALVFRHGFKALRLLIRLKSGKSSDKERLNEEIKNLYNETLKINGVKRVDVYTTNSKLRNKFDLMIKMDLTKEALKEYQTSDIHNQIKERFDKKKKKKTIFDCN